MLKKLIDVIRQRGAKKAVHELTENYMKLANSDDDVMKRR